MDLEARSLQPSQKSALLAKLREYKSDLNNLKKDVKKSAASSDYVNSRDELLESGLANTTTASADQRQRLLKSTDRLNQTGDRIKDSTRIMLETEEIGVTILGDLHSQRQTLLRATDTLHGVDDNLGKSKKILKNMSNRMSRNKCIMVGLIALLLVIIAVVLYFKLR
ncbi:hypothetical protein KP509_06G059500 [Ceratopteris richardii]|nr:hypothetical protein KP509_06G059500 [Ceratopteris richardii]